MLYIYIYYRSKVVQKIYNKLKIVDLKVCISSSPVEFFPQFTGLNVEQIFCLKLTQ